MATERQVEAFSEELSKTRRWIGRLHEESQAEAPELLEASRMRAVMQTGRSMSEVEATEESAPFKTSCQRHSEADR